MKLRFSIKNIKKRALVMGALFLFCGHLAKAAPLEKAVKLAKKHLVAGDRVMAAKTLRLALAEATPSEQGKLRETLVLVATYFVTNQAQKLYEQSNIQFYQNPEKGFDLLLKALEIEPNNYLLNKRLVKRSIYHGKCVYIDRGLSGILLMFPSYSFKNQINLSRAYCSGDLEFLAKQHFTENTGYPQVLFKYWYLLKTGALRSKRKEVEKIASEHKESSFLAYLNWSASLKKKRPGLARKALRMCHKKHKVIRENYLPSLCGTQSLLEQLKKSVDITK